MRPIKSFMSNATLEKFGYPGTLIREYGHWCVLLRPAQVTLGSLVMVCKDTARQFHQISPDAFAEMAVVTRDIETTLSGFRKWDRINYLMLMMVDPDVHFHVIPRYEAEMEFAGTVFADQGWPGPPDLGAAITPPDEVFAGLLASLKQAWPGGCA